MAASFTGSGGGCVIVVLADLLVGCDCYSYWFALKKRKRKRRRIKKK